MEFGTFSVSLAVKDIAVSKVFYENLGFEVLPGLGSVADKWLILQKDEAIIGLFQDMFPKNILTFNPTDARRIYEMVQANGTPIEYSSGMDKETGPCSFSFFDPDGNPILIDQHQ